QPIIRSRASNAGPKIQTVRNLFWQLLSMGALRIIFMGTPELAAASVRALVAAREFQVVAVVTQPDQPKGRGLKLQPSPVKEAAQQANLPVLQPQRAREESFIEQ